MRLLFILLTLICITPLSAQIVNGNFESWISFQGYLLLQGWEIYSFDDEASVTQDFDSYQGLYAAEITAIDTGLGSYGRAGTSLNIDYIPPSLDFYVKSASQFGSVAVEVVFLNEADTLDTFTWSTVENMPDWTFVSLPLDQEISTPTTAILNLRAEVGDFANGSAVLSVDQMSFGTVNSLGENAENILKLYPNPATDILRIEKTTALDHLELRDMSGKLIERYSVSQLQDEISIQHLPTGSYSVLARKNNGTASRQKLIISR